MLDFIDAVLPCRFHVAAVIAVVEAVAVATLIRNIATITNRLHMCLLKLLKLHVSVFVDFIMVAFRFGLSLTSLSCNVWGCKVSGHLGPLWCMRRRTKELRLRAFVSDRHDSDHHDSLPNCHHLLQLT